MQITTSKANMVSTSVSLTLIPEEILFGVKKFNSGDLTVALDVEGTGTDWGGGKNHDLTQLNFEVKGPPIDPNIRTMPLESMGTGTKLMFQRSMKAVTDTLPLPEEE